MNGRLPTAPGSLETDTAFDAHIEIDRLAAGYLREENPAESERLLGRLLFDFCTPFIHAIVRRKLGGAAAHAQDVEDVCSDALLDLVCKLDDVKSGAAEAIESFSRYAAVVAYHASNDYFRAKFPERHRLKNRLRHVLKPERGFDLWESSRGDWLCGRKKWRDAQMPDRGQFPPAPAGAARMSPPDLLQAIFDRAGGPLPFEAVVDWAAELWGVKDQLQPLDVVHLVAEPAFSAADEGELHARLERLWQEIGELPRGQRVALLLNLRAEDEKCAMELFPMTGVASLRQIAEMLEFTAEEFAALWTRLPLDDLSIAGLLQISRQQVINLRKSARKRLERRMPVIEENIQRRSR